MSSIAALKAQIEALELQVLKESEEKQVLQTQLTIEQAEKKERVLLARGEYFTQLRDVLGTERVDFTGGFRAICSRVHGGGARRWREKRLPEYTTLELELLAKVADVNVTADNFSYTSKSASDRESIAEKGGHSKLSKEEKDVIQNKRKNKLLRAQSSSGLSRSSKSGSEAATDPGVKMIDIGTVTNAAHLLAGNNSCSPTMGIFVQAIIGCDLEAKTNEQIRAAAVLVARGGDTRRLGDLVAKQKKVLQNLAYHQRHYKGFCNIANNLIQVPKGGHEKFFDIDCDWVIAPIMPFSDIIGWNPETVQWRPPEERGYWVMFIAGTFTKIDTGAYINFLNASTSEKEGEQVYTPGERERCSRPDVEQGIANLSAFIKAFADLATGRKANREDAAKLTPFDLIDDNARPPNLDQVTAARDKLAMDWLVTVPTLKAFDQEKTQVLKVFLRHENPHLLPEPMAVAGKGALNFMEMIGEKPVPACGESSIVEYSESSADQESDASSIDQISIQTPSKQTGIPDCITIVTPSPNQRKGDERVQSTELSMGY
ncbi:expressed unknown protein [Seminavis robusta]|uniref:Uncharacterized protein n=1 Tax=Seminavis robusta TaxID=568900 RepID=A0A9N8HL55_9STRA|nr:expressed unknown protein [Seminavis robusta]|eukprot:Sro783_g201880.1 n/a (544) ;mRNA; r:19741-21372